MEERNKHIDDIYRDGLSKHYETPREGVWSRIEQNLDKLDAANTPVRKTPGIGGKGFFLGISGVLLLSAALFFAYKQSVTVETKQVTIVPQKQTITTDNRIASKETSDVLNANTNAQRTENIVNNNTIASADHSNQKNTKDIIKPLDTKKITPVTYQSKNTVLVPGQQQVPQVKAGRDSGADMHDLQPVAKTKLGIKQSTVGPLNTVTVQAPIAAREQEVVKNIKPAGKHQIQTKQNTIDVPVTIAVQDPVAARERDAIKDISLAGKQHISDKNVQHGDQLSTVKVNEPVIKKDNIDVADGDKKKINNDNTSTSAVQTSPVVNNTASNSNNDIPPILPAAQQPLNTDNTFADAGKMVNKKEINQQVVVPNAAVSTENVAVNNIVPNDSKNDKKSDFAIPGTAASEVAVAHKQLYLPFDMGVKFSYETGTGQYSGTKGIISGYAEMPLTKKMSLLFEPGLMLTSLSREINYGTNPYYNNPVTKPDSFLQVGGADPKSYYKIYQLYDSMAVTRKSGRPLNVGLDLPILGRYQLTKTFSVMAGFDVNISSLFKISETIGTVYHATTDTLVIGTKPASEFASILRNYDPNHTTAQYETLQQPTSSPIRLGYTLGIGYKINAKTQFELMMTQTITNQDYIPDANVKTVYTQPYFRFTIGYNLYKHNTK